MNKLNLQDIIELTEFEQKELDGGNFLLEALAGALVCDLFFEGISGCYSSFQKGYKAQW